jgi:hypothetical protein
MVEDVIVLVALGSLLMALVTTLHGGEVPQWLVQRVTGNDTAIQQLTINTEHRESVLETEIQELSRKVDSQGNTLLWILGFSGLIGTKSGADVIGRLTKRIKKTEDD